MSVTAASGGGDWNAERFGVSPQIAGAPYSGEARRTIWERGSAMI